MTPHGVEEFRNVEKFVGTNLNHLIENPDCQIICRHDSFTLEGVNSLGLIWTLRFLNQVWLPY